MKKNLLLLLAICFVAIKSFATVYTVTVNNNFFSPANVNMNTGDTVKWVWAGSSHTSTSGTIPGGAASWNSNILSTGTFSYKPTVAGTYNYSCTLHSGMDGTLNVTACVPPTAPNVSAGGGPLTACAPNAVTLVSSVTTGVTFQWKLAGNPISGATSSTYVAGASGSYSVTITNGCGTATSTPVTVTINPLPTTPVATVQSGLATACNGSVNMPTLGVATVSGITYQWKNGTTAITGATSATYLPTASGSYNVTATNSCGSVTSNSLTITILPIPATPGITPNGGTACAGIGVTLSTNTIAGIIHQWMLNSVSISGANLNTFTANTSGTYTVRDSNSCGVATSAAVTVTINPSPVANFTVAPVAGSQHNFSFTNTTPGTNTYSWNFGDGSPASTLTNPTHDYLTSGAKTVVLTATASGCSGTKTTTVNAVAAGVGNINGSENIQISPNPANGVVHIQLANTSIPATVTITDIRGQQVVHQQYGHAATIDINTNNFASGIYTIQVAQDGQRYVQRLSVAH